MDAITLLRDDHRDVEKLFKAFEKAGPNAHKLKRNTVDKIITALSVHAVIEEEVFYPSVRAEIPAENDEVLEAIEEHHVVKLLLTELQHVDPTDERFDAKVTVLIENVRHHVKEEEQEMFPAVRKALGRKRLGEIGDAMATARKSAPTRPHPLAPDTPPGNVIAGSVAAVVDKARDKVGL